MTLRVHRLRSTWSGLGVCCAVLIGISACGSAATTAPTAAPAPTAASVAAPTAASAGVSTEPTVAPKATPIIGAPKALRDDIKLRKLFDTGGSFVRLKRDPSTDTIYYLDADVNIYKLDVQAHTKGTPVYKRADVGPPDGFIAAGMAFAPDGALYVLGNVGGDNTNQGVVRKGVLGGDGKRTWTTLVSTAPYQKSNTQFDHMCNGIVVSPDGKYLYMNSGSRSDHGEIEDSKGAFSNLREVPLTSAIFRVPTDSKDLVLPNDEAELKSKGYMFADGTRNSYDLAFAANGDLFAGDNGPDADLPDELNWLQEGHHYGFPWRFGDSDNPDRGADYDPAKDGRLQQDFFAVKSGFYKKEPDFPAPPAGVTFTDPVGNMGPAAAIFRTIDGGAHDAATLGKPLMGITSHRSPLGLVFDNANALGGDLKGDLLMLSWGSAAGNLPDPGRDLLDVKLTKNGDAYQAKMTQLAVGFNSPIDAALLGNKLYVLEWGGKGGIWEVSLP